MQIPLFDNPIVFFKSHDAGLTNDNQIMPVRPVFHVQAEFLALM